MTGELQPLAERILSHLPGSRAVWITAWALVPSLNAGLNLLLDTDSKSAVWEQSRTQVILFSAGRSLGGYSR